MTLIIVEAVEVFLVQNRRQVCLLENSGKWWVYLTPIFGNLRRAQKMQERCRDQSFSFKKAKDFGPFKAKYFREVDSEALFLGFEDFQTLMALENKKNFGAELTTMLQKITTTPSGKPVGIAKIYPRILKPGYIYLVSFPTLGVGKFGATTNWKEREQQLKRLYHPQMIKVCCEYSPDAWGLEAKIARWLKEKQALAPLSIKGTESTKETFDFSLVSLEEVGFFLNQNLFFEGQENQFSTELKQIWLRRLETDRQFAFEAMELHFQIWAQREAELKYQMIKLLPKKKQEQAIIEFLRNPDHGSIFHSLDASRQGKKLPKKATPSNFETTD